MGTKAKVGLGDIYNYIMCNAHLDEYVVVKKSPSLETVSFVELDVATRRYVMPVIEDMVDANRGRAGFMLDISVLNLLRNGKDLDARSVTAIDVHFETLMKTAFRSRYLVVLADFLKKCDHKILLNIGFIPTTMHPTRVCDLLRYLIPIVENVSLQVSQENILTQDLTKISARYYVLTVSGLTRINDSMRRDMTLERLSKLSQNGKEIIVRNSTKISQKSDLAYYL